MNKNQLREILEQIPALLVSLNEFPGWLKIDSRFGGFQSRNLIYIHVLIPEAKQINER